MNFDNKLSSGVLIFDGAMGTQIQTLALSDAEWDGKIGCSEVLNLTCPDKIQKIHENYLNAGADVIETNTFGANEIVLSEYGMGDKVIEINRIAAQIACNARDKYSINRDCYVAGSIGPGTKLISLGQTDFDTMYQSYTSQVKGLIEGGVDLFIIETCQDLLQIKIALLAVKDTLTVYQKELPIIVTVTVETSGSLLIGSNIDAVLTVLEPFNIDAFGLNCATGPDQMRPYIKQICERFRGPVICQPNAGLPENIDGEMVYTLSKEKFVEVLSDFISEDGVQIVGGCCGTTPEFILLLSNQAKKLKIAKRNPTNEPGIASIFSGQQLKQNPGPFFVGERTNTNGSKQFREYLLDDNWDGLVDIARQQLNTGAHGLDLCVAYTGRNELSDMSHALFRISRQINLPIFIDSTDVNVIEFSLKNYGGRAVINSINLEDGEDRVNTICALAKRYGAALIALTIDENGMALTVEKKFEIAKRIYEIAVQNHGLRPEDLIFDTLTFTLGSGDNSLKKAGLNTLSAIKKIKEDIPGVFTILGISNISFGLNPYSREVLNSVFLAEAVNHGLDLAIVNVKKIIPLYKLNEEDKEVAFNLIYDHGGENPLLDFISHFEMKKSKTDEKKIDIKRLSLEEKIKLRIVEGNRTELESMLLQCLNKIQALEIVNTLLIPAMKTVGDLFGKGEMQLPFVLQSAEVMKYAVGILQPHMDKKDTSEQKSIVLATVRGDVHDIGKNLVDIILTNNGYKVYNLGIKCEVDTILAKAHEVNADAIGMSGLLVKSTVVMKENLEVMKHRNIHIPVLLGGAALTKSYVEDICGPILDSPVVYCPDAFSGLKVMDQINNNELENVVPRHTKINLKSNQEAYNSLENNVVKKIKFDFSIPQPPFWGEKIVTNIDIETVFSYLNEIVLFRGRWGYRRGKLTQDEYNDLLNNEVKPIFDQLKAKSIVQNLIDPKVIYGYYPCNGDGENIVIYYPDSKKEWLRLNLPRQKVPPYRSIADFFLPLSLGRHDIIALQVVTIGDRASEEANRLFKTDQYKNYMLFHGLSVELAEALAEYWHQKIREELSINESDGTGIQEFAVQKYRGSRYSFGYPACPDLAENRKIFEILEPERIGVSLSEEDQMIPEQTTSAFIVHHPQAKYFTLD